MTVLAARLARRGFTLIELLVCLGIITILIALLLPALNAAKDSSRAMACAANLKIIGGAMIAYSQANEDGMPTCALSGQRTDNWVFWQAGRNMDLSALAPYIDMRGDRLRELFRCPAQPVENQVGFQGGSTYPLTYTYNASVWFFYPMHYTRIHNLGGKILVYDENENADDDIFWYGTPRDTLAGRHGSKSLMVASPNGAASIQQMRKLGNVLFCDDHVEMVTNDAVHDPSINDLSLP